MTLLQGCIEENTRLRFQKAATSAITLPGWEWKVFIENPSKSYSWFQTIFQNSTNSHFLCIKFEIHQYLGKNKSSSLKPFPVAIACANESIFLHIIFFVFLASSNLLYSFYTWHVLIEVVDGHMLLDQSFEVEVRHQAFVQEDIGSKFNWSNPLDLSTRHICV